MWQIYFIFCYPTVLVPKSTCQGKENCCPTNSTSTFFPSSGSILTSSPTSYSYSAPTTATLTTTPTPRPVLPLCNQFLSYPKYSLPPTTNTTNPGLRTILSSSAGSR